SSESGRRIEESMTNETGKSPKESAVETRYLIMPHQANPHGTAFGGVIVAWIDMVAAMTAQRHCGNEVVTAGIDSLIFKEPIRIGDHVVLRAAINYVSRSSMEVGVQVTREDPYTGEKVVATTAHLTFVALDQNKKPTPVPPIVPETDEEKQRYENARLRVAARKALLKKMT
ncbi:MAG TPA: acyl-CoA thioesterase, partial [Sedimentisphaerales bacterium]|nr:acyl-CoA thioesterase [Sedimentisphaerales bacterium]